MSQPLVRCICRTYGRHTSMDRTLAFWLAQDYQKRELVILNTAPVPLTLSADLSGRGDIRIYNQQNYSKTGKPYTNVGHVSEDAVRLARGDIFVLWEDDDLMLPNHLTNGVKGLLGCGKLGWKPARSWFTRDGGSNFEWARNAMEASAFVHIEAIRRLGFRPESGPENLAWMDGLKAEGQFVEDEKAKSTYVYCWGDPIAAHKQSGDMMNANNFENHKRASTDFGRVPLDGRFVTEGYWSRLKAQFPQEFTR